MTFFRHVALLLPSAFLLGVLLFLLTHGRPDPGFGAYPFVEQWGGGSLASSSPELRFVGQAAIFFLPLYLVVLLLILLIALAESALFGPPGRSRRSAYRGAFARTFAILFLLAAAGIVFFGDRMAARYAPGALVAPVLAAAAPFLAVAAAVIPAAILAIPVSALSKASPK